MADLPGRCDEHSHMSSSSSKTPCLTSLHLITQTLSISTIPGVSTSAVGIVWVEGLRAFGSKRAQNQPKTNRPSSIPATTIASSTHITLITLIERGSGSFFVGWFKLSASAQSQGPMGSKVKPQSPRIVVARQSIVTKRSQSRTAPGKRSMSNHQE